MRHCSWQRDTLPKNHPQNPNTPHVQKEPLLKAFGKRETDMARVSETNKAYERMIKWGARFEGVIPTSAPYIRRSRMLDALRHLLPMEMPGDARIVVLGHVTGVRDEKRAPGWPFAERRLTVYMTADRVAASPSCPSLCATNERGTGVVAQLVGIALVRLPWTLDEAIAFGLDCAANAEAIMSVEYNKRLCGAHTAAFMHAAVMHAQGKRKERPIRTSDVDKPMANRLFLMGWLGVPWSCSFATADCLAIDLGAFDAPPSDGEDQKTAVPSIRAT